MSTASGDKVILERVTLLLRPDGSIRLYIVATGNEVVCQEDFVDWNTALDLMPRRARDWMYGVILSTHNEKDES